MLQAQLLSPPQGDAQQQLLTLARMQSTLRHRRIEHLSFLEASTIEFPPIASVTLAFPSLQPHRSEVKNSPRRRRIAELEKYIERHGERVSRDEAARIIFASPLTRRTAFNRTLRSGLSSTLDPKASREGVQASKSDREKHSLEGASGKLMQQSTDFKEFKAKLLAEIGVRAKIDARYSSLAMSSDLEQTGYPNQSQRLKPKPKKQHVNRIRIKNIHFSPQRYSPWRSEELEDELVL